MNCSYLYNFNYQKYQHINNIIKNKTFYVQKVSNGYVLPLISSEKFF